MDLKRNAKLLGLALAQCVILSGCGGGGGKADNAQDSASLSSLSDKTGGSNNNLPEIPSANSLSIKILNAPEGFSILPKEYQGPLSVHVSYKNGAIEQYYPTRALKWSSSNESVLRVSEDGIVSAVGFGTARVTVQFAGLEGFTTFGVSSKVGPLKSVSNTAMVRADGTLRLLTKLDKNQGMGEPLASGNDWQEVVTASFGEVQRRQRAYAIKKNGSLWQIDFVQSYPDGLTISPPIQLGSESDWTMIRPYVRDGASAGLIAKKSNSSYWWITNPTTEPNLPTRVTNRSLRYFGPEDMTGGCMLAILDDGTAWLAIPPFVGCTTQLGNYYVDKSINTSTFRQLSIGTGLKIAGLSTTVSEDGNIASKPDFSKISKYTNTGQWKVVGADWNNQRLVFNIANETGASYCYGGNYVAECSVVTQIDAEGNLAQPPYASANWVNPYIAKPSKPTGVALVSEFKTVPRQTTGGQSPTPTSGNGQCSLSNYRGPLDDPQFYTMCQLAYVYSCGGNSDAAQKTCTQLNDFSTSVGGESASSYCPNYCR